MILGGLVACAAAMLATAPAFAFNKNNPRWEAPQHAPNKPFHKPYRPQHRPPEDLPEHPHHRPASAALKPLNVAALAAVGVGALAAVWIEIATAAPALPLAIGIGVVLGPATKLVVPGRLFGPALLPLVGFLAAFMLFEAVRRWRWQPMPAPQAAIAGIGWGLQLLLVSTAAVVLLDVPVAMAVLLAVIIAGALAGDDTGATSRSSAFVRPQQVWGALAALLLFQVARAVARQQAERAMVGDIIAGAVIAVGIGVAAGMARRYSRRAAWLPAALEPAATPALLALGYAGATAVHPDAGLIAVAAMAFCCRDRAVRAEDRSPAAAAGVAIAVNGAAILVTAGLPLADIGIGGCARLLLVAVAAVAASEGIAAAARRAGIDADATALTLRGRSGYLGVLLAALFAARLHDNHLLNEAGVMLGSVLVLASAVVVGRLRVMLASRLKRSALPTAVAMDEAAAGEPVGWRLS